MERQEDRPSQEGSHGHSIKPEDAVPDDAASQPRGPTEPDPEHVVEEKGREDRD